MSFEVLYSIFADKIILEEETRKPSLIGIFEAVIRLEGIPIIPTFAMYTVFKGESGYHEGKVKLFWFAEASDSETKEIEMGEIPLELEIEGDRQTCNFVFSTIGFPILGNSLKVCIYNKAEELIHTSLLPVIEG